MVQLEPIQWDDFDVIFLASGFESRSTHLLESIPHASLEKCIVLGFPDGLELLSRTENDRKFRDAGLIPFVSPNALDYQSLLREKLLERSRLATDRPFTIFVDYSVMTRGWYAYILTWIKYSGDVAAVDITFSYSHGEYHGEFKDFQIDEVGSMEGFEGVSAGSRQTMVLYGLGYDKFATLAIHERMQPDRFICMVATDDINREPARHVLRENAEMIEASGQDALMLPLDNLGEVVEIISKFVNKISELDEVIAVPMGPKIHVLGTLVSGHKNSRLTCMHPRGTRARPVQVIADGRVSSWKISYR